MSKSPHMSTPKCTDSRLQLRVQLAAARDQWGGGVLTAQRASVTGRLKRQMSAGASLTGADRSVRGLEMRCLRKVGATRAGGPRSETTICWRLHFSPGRCPPLTGLLVVSPALFFTARNGGKSLPRLCVTVSA